MFSADTHAVLLLSLPVIAAAGSILSWKGVPPARRWLLSFLGGIALAFLSFVLTGFPMREGPSTSPSLFGGLGVAIAMFGIADWRIRYTIVGPMVAMTFIMAWNHAELVSHRTLTSNPAVWERFNQGLAKEKDQVAQVIWRSVKPDPAKRHPPSWLGESELVQLNGRSLWKDYGEDRRYEVAPLWHSPFSGIHAKREIPVSLWFPGGSAEEGLAGLEWRDRPAAAE